jgi:hypothetical protein
MAARSDEWPSAHSAGSSMTLVESMTKRVPTNRSAPASPNPWHCSSLSDGQSTQPASVPKSWRARQVGLPVPTLQCHILVSFAHRCVNRWSRLRFIRRWLRSDTSMASYSGRYGEGVVCRAQRAPARHHTTAYWVMSPLGNQQVAVVWSSASALNTHDVEAVRLLEHVLAMICEAQAFNIHFDRPCVNTIVAYGLAVLAAAQAL